MAAVGLRFLKTPTTGSGQYIFTGQGYTGRRALLEIFFPGFKCNSATIVSIVDIRSMIQERLYDIRPICQLDRRAAIFVFMFIGFGHKFKGPKQGRY